VFSVHFHQFADENYLKVQAYKYWGCTRYLAGFSIWLDIGYLAVKLSHYINILVPPELCDYAIA
jgi:hypothetical protein